MKEILKDKEGKILNPHIPRYDKLIEIVETEDGIAKKYSNGFLECFGKKKLTKQTGVAWGSYFATTCEFTYPVNFKEVPFVFGMIYPNSGMFLSGIGSESTQTNEKTTVRCLSVQAYTNTDITYQYYAIGKWK